MPTAADLPTAVSAEQFETTLLVTWTPPTMGDTPTGYVVTYEASGSSDSMTVTSGSISQLNFSISEVGVAYSVNIVTLSNHLPSTVTVVTVISTILSAPNQPTSLSAVHQTPTNIHVYWTALTGTITGYEITLQSEESSTPVTVSAPVSVSDGVSSYVIDSGVSADVDYSISIVAHNRYIARSSITGPVFAARGEMYFHATHVTILSL